jgi:hypothetical protein
MKRRNEYDNKKNGNQYNGMKLNLQIFKDKIPAVGLPSSKHADNLLTSVQAGAAIEPKTKTEEQISAV